MLYVIEPYSLNKNLGEAYNDHIRHYSADDWLCIKDVDTTFLTPDAVRHIHEYTQLYPDTGLFTCFTNRVANREQLLGGLISNVEGMKTHLRIAINQKRYLYEYKELVKPISGFLMVVKKSTWDEIKFSEDMMCLGVDNDYHNRLVSAGKSVRRMNGIYVWHTYRLLVGKSNKSHLV